MDGDKLKEININNCVQYYLGDLININDIDFETLF